MRNLKRALSLAVASVMLIGMMVVGTGASYADVTSEENQEAIEVLQAVGIMTGDDEGNFNPDQNVTRNEMAVIMCNLMDYTVSSYAGTAPFTDVPSWAEPYVAACWTHSITGGTSATTYSGDDPVTTAQAALMLMKALGYFQYQSDFGYDWQVATVSKGSQIGIFDNVDTAAAAALTRNDVAQMVLNALETPMVEYSGNGGTTITGEGFQITTGEATYDERTSSNSDYGQIEDERSTNNGRYIVQLGEDLYDGDLEKISRRDGFGRPGTRWNYSGEEIGTYADSADDSMVIVKTQDAQQILVRDNDGFNYNTGDLADDLLVYVNGDQVTDAVSYATLTNADLQAGDVVELFENDDNEIETISVIRYSLAKITDVEDSLSSTYTNRGATYAIDLENLNESSVGLGTYYDVYTGDAARELKGFAASTYTEDTVLAVALRDSDNAILTSSVATDIAGTVTAYSDGSKANITLDGNDYALHGTVDTSSGTRYANDAAGAQLLDFNYDDSTYTIYTDANGFIIGIDETESVKIEDVYYVAGVFRDQSRGTAYYAQAVSVADGTVTEFKVSPDEKDFDVWAPVGADAVSALTGMYHENYMSVGSLYTFERDGSNYDAVPYTTGSDSTYYVYGTGGRLADNVIATADDIGDDLARDDTRMSIDGARVYLDDSTNYIKVEDKSNDIDVSFVTGGTSVKQNNSGAATTAIALATRENNNYVAAYVILISNNFGNASSDDVVFVHEPSDRRVTYTDAEGESQRGYELDLYFLDGSGTVETVTADANYDAGFYTWEINDDGVYELTADVDPLSDSVVSNNDYDDEIGYVGFTLNGTAGANGEDLTVTAGHELTGLYNNALSAADLANGVNTMDLSDVDLSANVIIRDDRSASARDADVYTSEIESVSQLKTAIDRSNDIGGGVKAVLYYDDGEVIMVYVLEVANGNYDPSQGGGDGEYTITNTGGEGQKITVTSADGSAITIAQAKVQKDGANYDYGTMTLTFEVESRSNGKWEPEMTFEATATSSGGDVNARCQFNGNYATEYTLPNGTYRVTITASNDTIGELNVGTFTFEVQ